MLETLLRTPAPALLWQGNDGFLIHNGHTLLATDLDLTLGERIAPPTVDPAALASRLDVMLITHGHEDHFSTRTVEMLLSGGNCRFVIPESCREKAMGIPGLAQRAHFVRPGDELHVCGVPIRCIRALHGHIGGTIYAGASLLDCGYVFTMGSLTFYQPGDTVPLEEHLSMPAIDVLFVSPTEHNMGVRNALNFIRTISPRTFVLQHHSTYHEHPDNLFWAHGFVEEVTAALSDDERKRCILPDQHTVYAL